MSTVKYKVCKNCGNRNHPASGQCPWCGARLRRPLDWFSTMCVILIVAIIGIESGFNPFAESAMGAKGLMQIIPRFHMDKVPGGLDGRAFLDPVTNIQIGALVLQEAIQRRGGLAAGLQYYAGSTDPEGLYASKVMAEKARLEQAAKRSAG